MTSNFPTIGCVILTYQGRAHLSRGLPPLLQSPLKPRVLVVDSSSSDGTADLARELGAEVLMIPSGEFNHGGTRELARRHLGTDIVVMLTQDAYLVDEHALGQLVAPLLNKQASIAYARQIPYPNASFFEAFPREFNYPEKSQLRGIEDLPHHGVYTFFCSNSCAAYKNSVLDEIGGFPRVLLGEDTVATAKILRKGYKIAYVAEAKALHSHCYSLKQEFCRHFDTGLARTSYAKLLIGAGKDSKRGQEYVRFMIKKLIKTPHLLPYGFAHILTKWLGYRLGVMSVKAPTWFKKMLSSQKYYWK